LCCIPFIVYIEFNINANTLSNMGGMIGDLQAGFMQYQQILTDFQTEFGINNITDAVTLIKTVGVSFFFQ
jgi:hypothetical protein